MNTLQINTYRVVDDAVERGVEMGWRRAHKHNSAPSPDVIRAAIADAIMLELSEVVRWPEQS